MQGHHYVYEARLVDDQAVLWEVGFGRGHVTRRDFIRKFDFDPLEVLKERLQAKTDAADAQDLFKEVGHL